jgi:hypothetical protein
MVGNRRNGKAVEAPHLRSFRERVLDAGITTSTSWEEANDRLYRAGLTDGLPIVPPTPERLEAMLAGGSHAASGVLGTLMPSFVAATVWDVAVNAVMAGCEPGYLPIIEAAVEAVADPDFNLLGIQTTTGAATPALIVNGPVAAQLGINSGSNCLGQGSKANATIGRALRLILQNVGGGVPGVGDMATHGQPGKYTWCFAENELASPWAPLSVDRGFPEGTNTLSAAGVVGSIEVVLQGGSPVELCHLLAQSMVPAGNVGSGGTMGSGQALVLLPPESAQFFASHGWSREDLQAELFRDARCSCSHLPQGTMEQVRDQALERGRPFDGTVPVARSSQDIFIVVTGGVGIKATVLPTWGGGTELVTRRVHPLDA